MKLEEALKEAIKLYYLDKPAGMTDYEFSQVKGKRFVELLKLVKWKKGEMPFCFDPHPKEKEEDNG